MKLLDNPTIKDANIVDVVDGVGIVEIGGESQFRVRDPEGNLTFSFMTYFAGQLEDGRSFVLAQQFTPPGFPLDARVGREAFLEKIKQYD